MNTIAFYISDHGFGHSSRNIPIIEELCKHDNIKIVIKTGKNQLSYVKQSLSFYSSKISFYECNNDVGLILFKGSAKVDKITLYSELGTFTESFYRLVETEKRFLEENDIKLVISDITPWIFKPCQDLAIKSVLISNFTWTEIYRELGFNNIAKIYEEYYNLADEVLVYPISTGFEKNLFNYKYIGMSCRTFNKKEVEDIRKLSKRKKVYVSLGRSVEIEKVIDVSKLNYTFIYTEGIDLVGPNTIRLPRETNNTHDYIKACDYVITKAGWGTVCETICAEKPMIVLNREDVFEDRITLKNLKELGLAVSIDEEDLNVYKFESKLNQLPSLSRNYRNLKSEYKESSSSIASYLINLLN